ncbi:glycosyltransferase family 4 protein [Clostridium sp. Marseille-P3244]|uniref:glycosyltransferase family 4 protein n=1 Tax=Clostridium sp. Marseille-P3244 TaxID=1871020 RepID=UPI0009301684|nr:glycosyltransferase family 4 protein [Clostridium sp. Marseille-P3244]
MLKVDVISSMSLTSGIGPVQTIKRIINSKDFFNERGYDLGVFTADKLNATLEQSFKSKNTVLLRLAKKAAKYFSRHTKFYAKNRINNLNNGSKRILDYYDTLDRTPDIIVFHGWQDCYEYLMNHRKDGVKICLFIHSDGSPDGNKMILSYYPKLKGTDVEKEMDRQLEYTLQNVDAMACITKIEEKNLLSQYPFLQGKTVPVINGISDLTENQLKETNRIRSECAQKKYRFISVGSMNGRKGHLEVIEALHQTRPKLLKDIQVLFVGDGQEKSRLMSLVEKYGLTDCVKFVGAVPNNDVYKYQAQSNISILISKLEGLPLALLEGLRSGTALISTNVSGIPEVVHNGENGILINYSQKELNEVFNNLDKYDWDSMGKVSRKMFEDYYNFPRMREDYIRMLQKAFG